jgi:hypothetical protein
MARKINQFKKVGFKLMVSPYTADIIKFIAQKHRMSYSQVFVGMMNEGMRSYYHKCGVSAFHKSVLKGITDKRIDYGIETEIPAYLFS